MAIRYRSEGFYLSFHLYLSVNVALVNEQANQLCEFGENYFGGSQKWAWLTWLRLAVFLSPVPGVQIVESGEGKKKRRCGAAGRGGERVREVKGKKRAGRALSSPFGSAATGVGIQVNLKSLPKEGRYSTKSFLQRASAPGSPRSMPLPIYTPPGRFLDVTQRSSNVALQLRDIEKPATKENIAIVTKSKNFSVYKRCLCFIFENDTSFTHFVK